jgi:glutamine amidotransferase
MGNLHSVRKAFQKAGAEVSVISSPDKIFSADRLVIPGVGAFGDAVENLLKWELWEPILEFIKSGKPVLGICLGMQLMLEKSHEKGIHKGFGVIKGEVVKFGEGLKIPQIGWNQVKVKEQGNPLFKGIPNQSYFYFVHSFYTDVRDLSAIAATTDYGIEYPCCIAKDNLWGVQFHPEKSQALGLRLLENFLNL